MLTRAQASNLHTSPPPARPDPIQSMRPDAQRMRYMVHHLILAMEEKVAALEAKELLTESHQQLVIHISKMLEIMCSKFKAYLSLRDRG